MTWLLLKLPGSGAASASSINSTVIFSVVIRPSPSLPLLIYLRGRGIQ
jgi:hypothetical protein